MTAFTRYITLQNENKTAATKSADDLRTSMSSMTLVMEFRVGKCEI